MVTGQSIDTLAATIRAGVSRLEATADRAHSELWWIGNAAQIDVTDHNGATVGDITLHGEDYPGGRLVVTVTEAIQRGLLNGSPLRMEQQAARDRRLLDLLLAEKHRVAEDPWYTCPAATRERDGGTYAETDGGGPCSCRRDERVAAYLAVLAEGYEEAT